MKLWLFYRISFQTSLAPSNALSRLHAEIGPEEFWVMIGPFNANVGSNPNRQVFLGCARSDGGEFRNNLNSDPGQLREYNSFQALVRARIAPSARGSRSRGWC